jgi:hypothetical protein
MKKKRILWMIGTAVIAATLLFIWSNSLESVAVSASKSERAGRIIEMLIGDKIDQHILRKTAHFLEFALLGCELMTFLVLLEKIKIQSIVNILFLGWAAATVDESLQVLSSRGSSVMDVLLDVSGCLGGIAITIVVFCLVRLIKKQKRA